MAVELVGKGSVEVFGRGFGYRQPRGRGHGSCGEVDGVSEVDADT